MGVVVKVTIRTTMITLALRLQLNPFELKKKTFRRTDDDLGPSLPGILVRIGNHSELRDCVNLDDDEMVLN